MKPGNVPIISISLTREEKKLFDELCKEGHRGYSDEFRLLLEFYLKYKEKERK